MHLLRSLRMAESRICAIRRMFPEWRKVHSSRLWQTIYIYLKISRSGQLRKVSGRWLRRRRHARLLIRHRIFSKPSWKWRKSICLTLIPLSGTKTCIHLLLHPFLKALILILQPETGTLMLPGCAG